MQKNATGGGGQKEIDNPINYGTFSFQKYKVQHIYQHTKRGESGLPMMHEGYWWCTLVKVGMGCACKLPFQECGTTFLADLDVQMAWVLFFFSSVMHSICSRDLNSAPCNPC